MLIVCDRNSGYHYQKNMKTGITAFLLVFVLAFSAHAQTEMVWDTYGLGFTLPRGMKITENNSEIFSAERNDLSLAIVPFKESSVGPEELADLLIELAEEFEYDVVTDADELELDGLYGYYTEGRKDGAQAVLTALMDEAGESNYFVILVYQPSTRDMAIEMIASFYPYEGETAAATDMVWDTYGLGFTLPNGMQITENNRDMFSAERDDLLLVIIPFKEGSVGPEDLADFLIAKAERFDYDVVTDVDEVELDDLYGFYTEGEKDGGQALLVALMDEASDSNYFVILVYNDASRDLAIETMISFYPYDK